MKRKCLFLFTIILLINNAHAQEKTKNIRFFEGEQALKKLPSAGTKQEIDKFRCGDYFLFGHLHPGPTHNIVPGPHQKRLGFMLQEKDSDTITYAGLYLPIKFRTIINNEKNPPTVEIIMRDNALELILVRISKKEYEKSSTCLPKPLVTR